MDKDKEFKDLILQVQALNVTALALAVSAFAVIKKEFKILVPEELYKSIGLTGKAALNTLDNIEKFLEQEEDGNENH